MTILARAPVRNKFSENSSGSCYYDYKGDAIHAFNETLKEYGYHLNFNDCNDWYGDEGSTIVEVLEYSDEYSDDAEVVGYAKFTWYRMSSGRWEIIGYLT